MKQKLKNTQRGITLVALVITIIVLLILAMVSIKIAIDGGLIQKAKTATDTHTIRAEKEAIQLGYSTYQMDLAKKGSATLTVEGSSNITQTSDGGWDIAFKVNNYHLDKNGNITEGNGQDTNVPTEDLEYLRKELLGEDGKGQSVTDIGSYNGSTGDYSAYKFNNEKIKKIGGSIYSPKFLIINYNESVYKLSLAGSNTKEVVYLFSSKRNSREGQKVEYSYDGTEENKKEWTILYDYGDTVEIISPEAIGNLTIGYEDTETQGNDNFEKAVYSYNNAIERINNYTASLVTNPNKISVRSVGSNPKNKNDRNTTQYTSKALNEWQCQYGEKYDSNTGRYTDGKNVEVNEVLESGDDNSAQDIARISYIGISIPKGGCWLASRSTSDATYYHYFYRGSIYFGIASSDDTSASSYRNVIIRLAGDDNNYNSVKIFNQSRSVCPIVKINYPKN